MILAERFGQLPDTVEREMSEFYYHRALAWIRAQNIEEQRIIKEPRNRRGKK